MTHAPVRRSRTGSIRSAWTRQPTPGAFVLVTKEKRMQLVAESETDALSWAEMLNHAAKIGLGETPAASKEQDGTSTSGSVTDAVWDRLVAQGLASSQPRLSSSPSPAYSAASPVGMQAEVRSNATSNMESRSTTEGSEKSSEAGSPSEKYAWSDVESSSRATPVAQISSE